jgi:hypothetical protein
MPAATVDELISQAKLLPPEQRELLLLRLQVELLPEQADPAVEAAWLAEAERRLDAVDRGEMGTVPWEQVRRDLGLQ